MPKNIFLITIDALRADKLKYINPEKGLMKNLDKFANENISFTNAIATGTTTPLSFPAILTGSYAYEFYDNKGFKKTIGNILQENNYTTAAFNSNPHFLLWGFSKGWDYFEDFLNQTISERKGTLQKTKKIFTKIFGKDSSAANIMSKFLKYTSASVPMPYAKAEVLNKSVFNWLEKNKEKQLFCWMHYMEPHYPYMPPEKYVKNISKKEMSKINRARWIAEHEGADKITKEEAHKIIELYNGEAKYVDEQIKVFLKKLRELKLYDESMIIITADHGEMLGEHKRYGHSRDVLYKDQLHVPLIIKTPNNKREQIKKPVSLIDLPYTIIELFGLKNSYLKGNLLWEREHVISESFKKSSLEPGKDMGEIDEKEMMISCQKNNWKLIIDGIHNKKELYNMDENPDETINLYEKQKKIAMELEKTITQHKNNFKKSEKQIISNRIEMLKKTGKI